MVSAHGSRHVLSEDYSVGEVLGCGGFSVVRRATSKDDGNGVAIKSLRRQELTDVGLRRSSKGGTCHSNPNTYKHNNQMGHRHQTQSQAQAQAQAQEEELFVSEVLLSNEIMVMQRIVEEVSPHPNVIHLIDVYEDASGVHLVLELCSGGELFDRIVSRERYSEAGAAAVVRQIANGLCSLHAAKIVHRDLKPENCLFLTPADDAPLKIMDFGLSHVEEVTSPVVGMFGSVDYVAPEALTRRSVLAASDMWSLGVILYILLCGYPPFHARTNREKQELILAGHVNFDEYTWKTVSFSAKCLISDLLRVDPYQRPSAAELLLHPWVKGDLAKQELLEPEVFRRLQSFNARRKFRAAGFASIISNKFLLLTKSLKSLVGVQALSAKELQNLHNHFKRISANGITATLAEFEQVLRAMDMVALVPLAPRIFDLFDHNRDGVVDMREIICGFTSLKKSEGNDALQLCFQIYDTDGSGYISKDELASMLRALPEEYLPPDITEPGKLDEMFDHMDANNDGRVSFDEFKEAIQMNSFLREAVLFPLRPG